jgi:hypothetical protein
VSELSEFLDLYPVKRIVPPVWVCVSITHSLVTPRQVEVQHLNNTSERAHTGVRDADHSGASDTSTRKAEGVHHKGVVPGAGDR